MMSLYFYAFARQDGAQTRIVGKKGIAPNLI